MLSVACCDSAMPCEGYAGNLCVADVNLPSNSPTLSGQRGRLLSGCRVEIQYTSLKVFA